MLLRHPKLVLLEVGINVKPSLALQIKLVTKNPNNYGFFFLMFSNPVRKFRFMPVELVPEKTKKLKN